MTVRSRRSAAEIRAELDHPVIDADGHMLEYLPAVAPYVRDALSAAQFEQWQRAVAPSDGSPVALDVRRATRLPQGNWWGTPARNTRDLATAALPALLTERMPELGLDHAVLYPSKGLGSGAFLDEELRRGVCHGFNEYYAATYGPYASQLTVAGIVPSYSPDEAVAEIEHCVRLGLKVVALAEGVLRPVAQPGAVSNGLVPDQGWWLDSYGLDSQYDYDPVWAACQRHGLPITFHAGIGTLAPAAALSITNYSHNHIGRFADRMAVVCKSLFFGGVTARFPEQRFAFLECGVGWAAIMLHGLVEHYEKRNLEHLSAVLDPALIDVAELERLMVAYGRPEHAASAGFTDAVRVLPARGSPPDQPDDWAAVGARSEDEVIARFVRNFFFGCEADDATVAFAYARSNPHGAQLRPVFSSDIGHWDVTDMSGVLVEASGLMERGVLTSDQFRDFVFSNPVALFAGAGSGFFDDTAIADAARMEVAEAVRSS